MNTVKHLDLFSGKATFAQCAERIFPRYECVGLCEIDSYAQALLRRDYKHSIIFPDVQTLDVRSIDAPDIITGGFPCQDISIAKGKNARGLNGEKSGLWYEMARICGVLRPQIIIIENTPGLLRRGLDTILANLAEMRYDAVWQVLSAAQFGYPHRRKRIFIAAFDTDRIGREEIHLYARTITEISQQQETRRKNIQQFSGLNSPKFWSESYAEFQRVDNGYSTVTNSSRLRIIGNAIIPECIDTILQALIPIISTI